MPLNASGTLSLGGATLGESVNLELGKLQFSTIGMNDSQVRALFEVVDPGDTISMSDGYSKSHRVSRGYFAGGERDTLNRITSSEIDGILFVNETALNPAAGLSRAKSYTAGVNTFSRGFIAGGQTSTRIDDIDIIQFINETSSLSTTRLSRETPFLAGVNSATRGYFAGGNRFTGTTTIVVDEIDGIQFSDETAINPAAGLPTIRQLLAGVNSTTKGYFAGGQNSTIRLNDMSAFVFSNETSISLAATLSGARSNHTGVNSATRGYFAGGTRVSGNTTFVYSNEIQGIQFSNETAIDPAASLSVGRIGLAGVNSTTKGYFAGGEISNRDYGTGQIDGIQFSNETAITTSAFISLGREGVSGVQNSSI